MSKILIIVAIFFVSFGCTKKSKNHLHETKSKVESYYTCSMHPQIHEAHPGKCPICHMTLTKVEVDKSEDHSVVKPAPKKLLWQCKEFPDVTSETEGACPIDGTPMVRKKVTNDKAVEIVAKVMLRKAQLKHFTPALFPVTLMKMSKHIRLLGSVVQAEDRASNVSVRVGGRVEKVYVESTGSLIRKGDPVVEIYSPSLITAGDEYLLARRSFNRHKTKDNREMLAQSESRLVQWGILPSQYKGWFKTKKVPRSIVIHSLETGIVEKRNAYEGKYFKEGQDFFKLIDLSTLWIEMDVYEKDSTLIKLGQKISLEFAALPGDEFEGIVDFINPILDSKSRTVKIRTTVKNRKGMLRPGMTADAELNIEFENDRMIIPRSAIIDTGKRKVVWVKKSHKKYVAKVIHSGIESDGYVEVKRGLDVGEEVVIDGNFLLDAQAQLFGGYIKMNKKAMHGHNH